MSNKKLYKVEIMFPDIDRFVVADSLQKANEIVGNFNVRGIEFDEIMNWDYNLDDVSEKYEFEDAEVGEVSEDIDFKKKEPEKKFYKIELCAESPVVKVCATSRKEAEDIVMNYGADWVNGFYLDGVFEEMDELPTDETDVRIVGFTDKY